MFKNLSNKIETLKLYTIIIKNEYLQGCLQESKKIEHGPVDTSKSRGPEHPLFQIKK